MSNYSDIIRMLRIAVPAAGAIILVLFFLWPTITKIRLPKLDKAQIRGDRTELINPHYEGKDEKGQRFVLTAARAIQTRADPDHVTLVSPTAAMEKPDNSLGSKVAADHGIFDSKNHQISLTQNVILTTPQGDRFITNAADVDLHGKFVSSQAPVAGGGPKLQISAQGFTYDNLHGLLTLTGPATLVLHETNLVPASAAAPASAAGTGKK